MSLNHAQPQIHFSREQEKVNSILIPPVLGSPLPVQPCGMVHIKHKWVKNIQRQFPLVLNPQAPMRALRPVLRDSASHQGSSRLPKNTAQHTETMSNNVSFVSVCACVCMCMCMHTHMYRQDQVHVCTCVWRSEVNFSIVPQILSTLLGWDFCCFSRLSLCVGCVFMPSMARRGWH